MRWDWRILKPKSEEVVKLYETLGISPLLANLLVNRRINHPSEADRFLNPKFSDLHDPFLFKDMGKAVHRLKRAVSQKEKILIYGDYDVDGITGMAILIKILRAMGAIPVFYIPHRVEEGYGISEEGVRFAIDNNIKLVITVDCGVTNVSQIEDLKRAGIDVIITDHHEPDIESLPLGAFCLLDPLYPGETYPDKYLSGAGVAFKLAQAISGEFSHVKEMLDLVALGTVADVCQLKGENRVLVRHGLSRLSETRRVGIKALLEVAQISKKEIFPTDVSFILGPRINAMGRLDSAELALKLFLTDSLSEALDIAKTLNMMNRKRQEIEEDIYNEAVNRIEREINFKDERAIVLGGEHWHQGVIGIVASKLTQRYLRPVILFSLKNKMAVGSGRVSLEKVHLFKILEKCKHLFQSYGGHRSACGIKMQESLLPEFRSQLNRVLKEDLDEVAFTPIAYIDKELTFDSLSPDLIAECARLAPFGEGNPLPTFISRRLQFKDRLGYRNCRNGRQTSIWVTDGSFTYQAKGKDFGTWVSLVDSKTEFDLVYRIQMLNQRGESHICLNVHDFQPLQELI